MPDWTKEQKLAIFEKDKNIIVSAGAGSGKTAVLSERVLEHVLSGINIDELLILTFTNAAAQEMKDRIRKKISEVPSLKEQLDKIDVSYITTFDSYALQIVKKYNHLLNISDNISIIDSNIIAIKKEEILTNIFERHYKDDNDFKKLINDFCLKDDKEVFESIISLNNKLDNSPNKKEILTNYINDYYNDNNIDNLIKLYIEFLLNKINTISNISDTLSHYTETKYIEKLQEALLPLLNSKDYNDIKFNVANITLPRLLKAEDEAKIIKDELSKEIKNLVTLTELNDIEEIKSTIYSTKDYVKVIINLIEELDKEITLFKYKNDSYEFIDIAKMAINILKDNESIRNELKNSYKEILIDEYQDTNDIQDIFISYIENNNVYMVGDVKQSIYRFRNANPKIFKSKYDSYAKNINGFKIDLTNNFRSRGEVINTINSMFNLLMDDNIGGASYLESHQMNYGLTKYDAVNKENYNLEILNYTKEDLENYSAEEIEIFTIAKDIQDKVNKKFTIMDKDTNEKRIVNYSDFCILIDRSSTFNLYKKVFEYLNIPITIYKDSAISDSVDISIIRNIYNLIILTKNKEYNKDYAYSYMSIARSYLFEYKDRDIFKTIKNKTYYESPIYKIVSDIASNLSNLNNKELYNLILNKFNFYKNIIKTGNINDHIITLDSIKKIIDSTSSFGYSPTLFLEYLDTIKDNNLSISLSLNKESSNSVKIMTIHTSKGLEYPICYFTGFSKKFNIDELKNKFYYDNYLGFIVPYVNESPRNTIIKTLLKNNFMEEEISEKLRLFYVALTRAREKIIIVGNFEEDILSYKNEGVINNETRLKYRSFKNIIDSLYKDLKPYIKNINVKKLNITREYSLSKYKDFKKLIDNKQSIKVNEYINNSTLIERKHYSKNIHELIQENDYNNINLGIKMHKVLEDLDFNNPDYSNLSELEKECAEEFIKTNIFKDATDILKEYEFIYKQDNKELNGVIDLLIIKDDINIIVDYKLKHTDDPLYKEQINGYKNYIESITNKKTKTYLYSILDKKLIEIK